MSEQMTVEEAAPRAAYPPPAGQNGGGAGLFGDAFADLPIGVYRTSADGRILMANRTLLRMLGYDSFEELARRDLENDAFEPSYHRARFKERLERDGEIRGLESEWARRDGTRFFARENARAVRDESGAVLHYEGTVEDFSDRRRDEVERQVISRIIEGVSTTANLAELFRLIHEAVGEVLYAENCFVALLDPATGLMHFEFFVDEYDAAPAPRPPGRGFTGYVLNHGRPLLLTDEEQRRMAEWGEVEAIGTLSASWLGIPLRTPGETIGALVVQHYTDRAAYSVRDVEFLTSVAGQIAFAIERKRAEDELKASAARLVQSNRELQDFASVASHDLQEPLRKIQAFGDRLKTKCAAELTDEGRDYLGRMQNAAGRMQTLINDLLTFSRVTTKTRPFAPVELAQVAHEVLADLEVRLAEVGGRVEIADLPNVDADPLQMRQLFQNLIGNALKFRRPEAPPVVRVSAEIVPAAEARAALTVPAAEACRLKVSDNGIGFDEKYLDRIFTVFQRLHGRDKYEGNGVGLAVCRRIAERHGGGITAESTPGSGATFVVTLPVRHPEGASHDE
ncbi:MAG TPA: ATP-binding protein [Pyrinomonadaceae bacterium]